MQMDAGRWRERKRERGRKGGKVRGRGRGGWVNSLWAPLSRRKKGGNKGPDLRILMRFWWPIYWKCGNPILTYLQKTVNWKASEINGKDRSSDGHFFIGFSP